MKNWWTDLYSVTEYAQIKKKSIANVRRLCQEGQLDAAKVGDTWVIRYVEHDRVVDDIGIGNVRI